MTDRLNDYDWYSVPVHKPSRPIQPMTIPRKRWTPPAIPRVTVPDLPKWEPSRPPTDVQAWLSARLDEWADLHQRADAWLADRRAG